MFAPEDIRRKILKQRYWEYLIPGIAVASLLISCIIVSSKKFFWNDELLSFYLLNDRSLSHMLVAWSDKFNQAPPLYFSLGWLWDKVFGSTELSLRLFSSVSLSISCIVVWTVLRRTYGFWSTTIGTLSVFCLSGHVLYHNAEVRMYGLFTTVCAFGLLQFDSINKRQKCSWVFLSINSLIHCTIVSTHLYGVFYSAAILISFIVRDKYFGIFRKNVYLSVLIGCTILIPLSPLIINQSNNSAKWFSTFTLSQTINMLIPFSQFSWFILILLIISILLYVIESSGEKRSEIIHTNTSRQISEISLLIFAAFFMLVPVAAWIITVTLKPLLNSRYIIPTITLSWSILLTFLTSRIIPDFQDFRRVGKATSKNGVHSFNLRATILSALTVALLLYPISYAMKFSGSSQRPGANDASYGYIDLPIAMEAGHDFLPRFYYAEKPSRYFHILDWDTAIKNVESVIATGDYVHLEALSRNYPFIQSIQSTAFLRRYDRFLVLNEKDQKWFKARIKNNPEYKIRQLGLEQGASGILEVFLVEHQH